MGRGISSKMFRRVKVLVVDDLPIFTEKVVENIVKFEDECQSTLTRVRPEFSRAASGYQALESVLEDRPDCVITDYKMAGMDGIELTRRLAKIGLPVLILTGEDVTTTLRAAAHAAGADHILDKTRILADTNAASAKQRRHILTAFIRQHARDSWRPSTIPATQIARRSVATGGE